MINKKKITKKVWYQGVLWNVVQIISPNDFDDYLLLSRIIAHQIHPDKLTHPTEMILIHCHNDEFFTNTWGVRNILKRRKEESERKDVLRNQEDRVLSNNWLDSVQKRNYGRASHI
jgi:hypothetical protein